MRILKYGRSRCSSSLGQASRKVPRDDGETVATIADLSDTVSAKLGDMVVDNVGRAYVACQVHGNGAVVCTDPDDAVTLVADGHPYQLVQ